MNVVREPGIATKEAKVLNSKKQLSISCYRSQDETTCRKSSSRP